MINVELNRLLVGKSLEEAKTQYEKNVTFRVVENNGEIQEFRGDLNKTKLNLVIKEGFITEVLGIY